MAPKEKAKELVDKFNEETWTDLSCDCIRNCHVLMSKECALICVNEILKTIYPDLRDKSIDYWNEVKEEINKL